MKISRLYELTQEKEEYHYGDILAEKIGDDEYKLSIYGMPSETQNEPYKTYKGNDELIMIPEYGWAVKQND